MTEERQLNTELREKARQWIAKQPWDAVRNINWWIKTLAAFAASIQAEACVELEAAEERGDEYKAAWAEIHNRFCGENGEPCQVCRLKAEREEGK